MKLTGAQFLRVFLERQQAIGEYPWAVISGSYQQLNVMADGGTRGLGDWEKSYLK